MKNITLNLVLITAFATSFVLQANAQAKKYWVTFNDKDQGAYQYQEHLTQEAIEKRKLLNIPLEQFSDIPLTNTYLEAIQSEGIAIINQSKWLNSVTAKLTPGQLDWLQAQHFVKEITPAKYVLTTAGTGGDGKSPSYSTAIDQMEPDAFHKAGLNGRGIVIGVIDAGFYKANKNKFLKDIFDEKRILGISDLVNPAKKDHYNEMETRSDGHGSTVLQMIAGVKEKEIQTGFATKASFYLARTDHGDNEFRGEEDYWIRAMEWMDSLGVRVINTSLGYALGFDDPEENYKPGQMDGNTAMITKAAQVASEEKGLLLIVSAGNEGSDPAWRVVSAPADAKGVVSVGATDPKGFKMAYSSTGPEALPYLKPDISCFSLTGTSFSAPVITGFAACLMQHKPEATNTELIAALHQSAHLYPYGNNFLGYGIPKAAIALQILDGKEPVDPIIKLSAEGKDSIQIKPEEKDEKFCVIFHKSDDRNVLKQSYEEPNKGKFKIGKPENAVYSTVVIGKEVYEVSWE